MFSTKKRVLIATDSQACLRALSDGPLRHHEHSYNSVWQAIAAAAAITANIDFQFVCSHCGLDRNEAADEAAKPAVNSFSKATQANVPITVAVEI